MRFKNFQNYSIPKCGRNLQQRQALGELQYASIGWAEWTEERGRIKNKQVSRDDLPDEICVKKQKFKLKVLEGRSLVKASSYCLKI